ncbi:nitrile hydratase subunit alpha [Sulfitobacter sp.]|uniref:nitrile hydratase subunit alpha n=1 Tax=Sulfitobacter sp. TaxID=1903071 RepID=UPI0032997F70
MHDHIHHHPHPNQPDEEDGPFTEYRLLEVALRELLIEKDVITQAELHKTYQMMDDRGPHNGARMVAKAWSDPSYLDLMRRDATAAAKSIGLEPTWLNLIALENTNAVHNVVVCTLCSCYPWPLLGLPPDWYKSRAYRSDVVQNPRKVLAEFGTTLPDTVEVRVHDSSADMRYLVVPKRPVGTEGWPEEELAKLVTRDSMIGVVPALAPEDL